MYLPFILYSNRPDWNLVLSRDCFEILCRKTQNKYLSLPTLTVSILLLSRRSSFEQINAIFFQSYPTIVFMMLWRWRVKNVWTNNCQEKSIPATLFIFSWNTNSIRLKENIFSALSI